MDRATIRRWGDVVEVCRVRSRSAAELVAQTLKDFFANNGLEWAAATAFYALLSFVPLLLAAALVGSLVVDPQWAVDRLAGRLGAFVPHGEGAVEQVLRDAFAQERRVGLVALPLLLWTGRRVLGTLTQGLNLVSDVDEKADSLVRRAVVELVLLLLIGGLFGLALASGFLIDLLWDALRFAPAQRGWLVRLVPGIVRTLLLFGAFCAMHWYVPRGDRNQRATVVGAAAATGLFLAARELFLAILPQVARTYGAVYGGLAPALIMMVWFWVVALITLFGGALASHVKVMLIEGRSAAEAAECHVARVAPLRPSLDRGVGAGR